MLATDLSAVELEQAILAAHSDYDALKLAELYLAASDMKFALGEMDSAVFLLTHAYVFALESGHEGANAMQKRLIDLGCEQPS